MNATDALTLCGEIGIVLSVTPDGLHCRAPAGTLTPELCTALAEHRDEIIERLAPAGPDEPNVGDGPSWNDCAEPPAAPCLKCGNLIFWTNPLGEARCQQCSPSAAAQRLLQHTTAIRRRYGLPAPPGTVDLLAELKSACPPPATPAAAMTASGSPPLPEAAVCTRQRPDGPCLCPVFWLDAYDRIRCEYCQPPLAPAMVRRRLLVVGRDQNEWEELASRISP